jgi:hypothetical protein
MPGDAERVTFAHAERVAIASSAAEAAPRYRSDGRRDWMSGLSPRRLAFVGLLAAIAGVVLDVVLVLAGGGGLSGGYIAGVVGGYVFYGNVVLIAVGVVIAGGAQHNAGVALMLVPALFEVGFLIGSQLSLWLLIVPSRT